jgi:DNA adenine methylase
LLKWPGGKRRLVDRIASRFPLQFGTYYEPFFGGGALYFATLPDRAVIADVNVELINCYKVVRDSPDELIDLLRGWKNSSAEYYRIRDYRPRTELRRAARFVYLSRLSFNGIHRVNRRGEFNVPYGRKSEFPVLDESVLRMTSATLAPATILACDFAKATKRAVEGDLVYFDPPYTVAHANNGFVKYNECIFSWADQERLATHAKALAARGCYVFVSNADHPSVREIYRGATCVTLNRHSVMSASSEHRRAITECLFILGMEAERA